MIKNKINQSKHKNYILFGIGTFFAFLAFYMLAYIALPFIAFGGYKYPDIDEHALGNILFDDILPLCILFCSLYGEIQIYKKEDTLNVKPFLYFIFAGLLFLLFVGMEIIIAGFTYPFDKDLRRTFVFFSAFPVAFVTIFFMIRNGVRAIKYPYEKKKEDADKNETKKEPITIKLQVQSDKEAKDNVKVVVKTEKSEMTIN